MFRKVLFVAAFIALPLMFAETNKASAHGGGIAVGYGGIGYGYPGVRVRSYSPAPYRPSSYYGVSPVYHNRYVPAPTYRRSCPSNYGYGGYRGGGGYGYPSYGRSGVSLRIGF